MKMEKISKLHIINNRKKIIISECIKNKEFKRYNSFIHRISEEYKIPYPVFAGILAIELYNRPYLIRYLEFLIMFIQILFTSIFKWKIKDMSLGIFQIKFTSAALTLGRSKNQIMGKTTTQIFQLMDFKEKVDIFNNLLAPQKNALISAIIIKKILEDYKSSSGDYTVFSYELISYIAEKYNGKYTKNYYRYCFKYEDILCELVNILNFEESKSLRIFGGRLEILNFQSVLNS